MRNIKSYPGRVIFDHLQKTAGQAVNAWLREALGAGCVTENLIGGHRRLIAQFGGEFSIISGHVAFHGEGFDPRYDYITCFRDPVDRAISWIFFVLENHNDNQIIELRSGVRSFLETDGRVGYEHILANSVTDHILSIYGDKPNGFATKLERTLAIVNQYTLWGLYERLDDFIYDFAAYLNVPAPKKLLPVNTTRLRPKVEEISPKLRSRIEELNELDIAFFSKIKLSYEDSRKRWFNNAPQNSQWSSLNRTPAFPYDGRGRVTFQSPPSTLKAGVDFSQMVTLHNDSSNTWEATRENPLNLSYHWLKIDRTEFLREGKRTPLPNGKLAAGNNCTFYLAVTAPDKPGLYTLQILPVQERYAWFDSLGFIPGELRIDVCA